MVDALLREFGLRVGRYTSPHLERVTERISLDGTAAAGRATSCRRTRRSRPTSSWSTPGTTHPLSFFETLTAHGVRVFADAPVDVAVVEVGIGGTWDATNVVDARRGRRDADRPGPPGVPRRHGRGDRRGEGRGASRRAASACSPSRTSPAAEVLLERAARGRRDGGPRRAGVRRAVPRARRRRPAASTCAAWPGRTTAVLCRCSAPHQAHNAAVALAAVEAFLGGGTRAARRRRWCGSGFVAVTSPGRLEVVRRGPTVLLDAAHNPAGATALAQRARRGLLASAGSSGSSRCSRTRTRAACWRRSSRSLDEVGGDARAPRPARWPPTSSARWRVDVFGGDRVEVVPRLPDAIDEAIALAEEDVDARRRRRPRHRLGGDGRRGARAAASCLRRSGRGLTRCGPCARRCSRSRRSSSRSRSCRPSRSPTRTGPRSSSAGCSSSSACLLAAALLRTPAGYVLGSVVQVLVVLPRRRAAGHVRRWAALFAVLVGQRDPRRAPRRASRRREGRCGSRATAARRPRDDRPAPSAG